MLSRSTAPAAQKIEAGQEEELPDVPGVKSNRQGGTTGQEAEERVGGRGGAVAEGQHPARAREGQDASSRLKRSGSSRHIGSSNSRSIRLGLVRWAPPTQFKPTLRWHRPRE